MTGLHARGVVVGVDGTQGSHAALTFAIQEAALRGSPLEVITAWTWAEDGAADGYLPEHARHDAQQIQDQEIALTLAQVDARPVLSRQVIQGDPAKVLRRLAKDAAYLVLGASKEGQWRRDLFGTVGDYCVRHATCAVMIVRDPTEEGTADHVPELAALDEPATPRDVTSPSR